MSYFSQLSQNIQVSTKNSTSNNITSAPTHFGSTAWYWCGQEENTLEVVLLQMSLHTTQNAIVYLDQSPGLLIQAGTVTTNGTTTLVGSTTTFSAYKVGESILVSGETSRTIATIDSETSLTVTDAFSTSASGLSFETYSWDVSDPFNYNVLENNFGINISAINSFYRVRVVLEFSIATTYLRLQSVLVPIGNPLPRSLDDRGNLKVATKGFSDKFGNEGMISPMKDTRVIESIKLVGVPFGATNDPNFWTLTNTGTASSSEVTNAKCILTSGTANNGISKITSVIVARFQFGQPLLFRSYARLATLVAANNKSYMGSFSEIAGVPQNGVAFSVDGTGEFSVQCFNNGTPLIVTNGNFNGNVSTLILDTNVHAFEIIYFTASAAFYADGVLIHTFIPTTDILYRTLHLPICLMTVNGAAGTVSRTIEVWNAVIMKMGKLENQTVNKYISGAVTAQIGKQGPGLLSKVILGDNTSAGTVIIYDALTATNIITTIAWGNNSAPSVMSVTLPFFTGLCYSTTGAGTKVTLVYE